MANHFHTLTVKSVERETTDAVCVEFALSDQERTMFRFEAGQHLTVRHTLDGEELRRNYSLCTAATDGRLQIGIKQMENGRFSTWANQHLQAGMQLEVMPPGGHFTLHGPALEARSFVFVAAGSGITPVLSLLATVLETMPKAHCTLIYANRNRGAIMFRERLEALKNKHLQKLNLVHILSREATDSPLHHGRITTEKCGKIFGNIAPLDKDSQYYLCGPFGMVQTVKDFLMANAIPAHHIHSELFTPVDIPTQQESRPATNAADNTMATSHLRYRLDGVEASLTMPQQGESVLDAIRLAGGDAPYACKGGVCCTCKARLLQGKVHMDVVYGLEPEEIEAGYILTCQSHPLTPELVISYDE